MSGSLDGAVPRPLLLRIVQGGTTDEPADSDGVAGEMPLTFTLSGWYAVRLFRASLDILEENRRPDDSEFDEVVQALIVVLNGLRIAHPRGKHPSVLVDMDVDGAGSPRVDVAVHIEADEPPRRPGCG